MDDLMIRFSPYIVELREFFKIRGIPFGSPDDLTPVAEALSSEGSFHDEMMSMLRSVIFRERGVVPRNELLELILVAAGGSEIDRAAQEVVVPVGILYTFVGEVLQSLKKKSYPEEEEDDEVGEADGSSAVGDQAYSSGEGAHFEAEATSSGDSEWNRDVAPERNRSLHGASDIYVRAQTISPHFEEPEAARNIDSASLGPKTLEASELLVMAGAPAPASPRHFFRNTMYALCLTLAAVLLWRHWSPLPTPGLGRGGQAGEIASVGQGTALSSAGHTATMQDPGSNSGLHAGSGVASSTMPLGAPTPTLGTDLRGDGSSPSAAVHDEPLPSTAATKSKDGSASLNAVPPPRSSRRTARPATPRAAQPSGGTPPNTPTKQGAYLVSSGVMDGNLISSPAPKYPKWASMSGVEGQVILQAVVSRSGSVVSAHVLQGHHLLRGAAVNAVKTWRYRPYVVRGKPTDVATIVIVDFRLGH